MSPFELDVRGLKEVADGLDELAKKAKQLNGENQVPFSELFAPAFMRKYTDFATIDEMLEATGYQVDSVEDFKAIPDAPWDSFVQQRTKFSDWREMIQKAGLEWTSRKLGLHD